MKTTNKNSKPAGKPFKFRPGVKLKKIWVREVPAIVYADCIEAIEKLSEPYLNKQKED